MPIIDNRGFQLQYPKDMQAQDTYFPEAIHFNFIKKIGVDLNDVLEKVKAKFAGNKDFQTAVAKLKSVVDAEKNRLTEAGVDNPQDQLAEFETKQANVILRAWGAGKTFFSEIQQQNVREENIGHIYLNMPNNITLSEEAGWAGESLGVVGALTKRAFKADSGGGTVLSKLAGSGVGHAGNLISAAAGGIVGKILSNIPGVSGYAGGLIGAIGGSVLQRGAEAAFSVAANPYMEMMFSGIGFRSFKFDFIFRARNKSEIDEVAKIIQMFRQHSRPEWQGGALGKSFMKYPGEYKIKFKTLVDEKTPDGFRPGGSMYTDNKYLPTLKDCVCSAVETNFTPESVWSAYERGAPVSITLGLSFNETELVMADDIAAEYPGSAGKQPDMKGYGSAEFGTSDDNLMS